MSKAIKIKNLMTGDTRRIALGAWPDLVELDGALRNIFGESLPSTYSLQYSDEDGDRVSITSTLELLEAAQTAERVARGGRPTLNLMLSGAKEGMGSVVLQPSSSRSSSNKPLVIDSFVLPPISTALRNNNSSNRQKQGRISKIYVDQYTNYLTRHIRRLMRAGYGWEQSLAALVMTGGKPEPAQLSLQQAAIKQSGRNSHVSRWYFDEDFTEKVRGLTAAGFPIRGAVTTLVKCGGNAQNTALELAGVFKKEEEAKHCDKCTTLLITTDESTGVYRSGWFCDRCRKNGSGYRWKCPKCEFDVCFACEPKPHNLNVQTTTTSTLTITTPASAQTHDTIPSSNAAPDFSLPESLRSTVLSLEQMGFAERDRNIELLVKFGGDVTKVATFLMQEQQQKELETKREAARERKRMEALRRREEERIRTEKAALARARLAAERKAQREAEQKRKGAAELVVKSPEKIGASIAALQGMGFDTISATNSLFNAGGDLDAALELLLKLND